MKKTIYLFLCTIAIALTTMVVLSHNDKNCTVSGKVVESSSKEVIDNALVTVSKKGVVIAKTFVNQDGSFKLKNLPSEVLEFTIQNVAYNCYSKTVNLKNVRNMNIGNVGLELMDTVLDELIIEVKRKI